MARININKHKIRNYLLLGAGCYLLFVLFSVPASLVSKYLLGSGSSAQLLNLQQIRGTLWKGEAQETMLGRVKLGKLNWDLNSLGLLAGNIDLDLLINGENTRANGNVAIGLGGKFAMEDVDVRLPAEQLNGLFSGFPVSIGGDVLGKMTNVEIKKNEMFRAKGRIVWQKAALRAPHGIELGDILIEMEPQNKNTRITISDQNETGQLKINLKLDVQSTGKYRWEGTLSPRNNDQTKLTEFLRFLGRPDSAGNYWISRSGQLTNW